MTAKIQFNGLILLASYIQRLYVNEQIKERLEQKSEDFPVVKDYFDSVNAIMPMFVQTKMLTGTQGQKLEQILAGTMDMMQHYFEPLNTSYAYKLRIVTSTLFAEKLMIQGILHLGEVFGEDVGEDMKKRLPFYEERTKMINQVVAAKQADVEPTPEVVAVIDKWYEGIAENQQNILQDMNKIAPMIGIGKKE